MGKIVNIKSVFWHAHTKKIWSLFSGQWLDENINIMITFSINEKEFSVGDAYARQTLLNFLRENEFYDVKRSCEEGICGACSIIR